MRVLSVVGARPQFVKLGPICKAIAKRPELEHVIVHTGQHYDPMLSKVFFRDLNIKNPDYHLGIGSGSHGAQTGQMLEAIEKVLIAEKPDWTLVYGDTNSTLAAAIAAVKQHFKIAHIEAGLRSFNRNMPEEHNRILTDHASDLLLAPTEIAMKHLKDEGLAKRSKFVGDVMTGICLNTKDSVIGETLNIEGFNESLFLLATIHRAENTDDPERLKRIIASLQLLPVPVLLLAHPRLLETSKRFGIELAGGNLHVHRPLPYPEMVLAIIKSIGLVTDSGGLQKEAFLLKTPCTTLRAETEWVETLADGWNILDPDLEKMQQVAVRDVPSEEQSHPYGDRYAADYVIDALMEA